MLEAIKSALRNVSAIVVVSVIATGAAYAQVQTVTGTLSVAELSAGQSTDLTVSYTATDVDGAEAYATGLGLRLHFNSSVIDMAKAHKNYSLEPCLSKLRTTLVTLMVMPLRINIS